MSNESDRPRSGLDEIADQDILTDLLTRAKPDASDVPAPAEAPAAQETSAEPEAPVAPEPPDEPEAPDEPEVPDEPEAPEAPEIQDVPEDPYLSSLFTTHPEDEAFEEEPLRFPAWMQRILDGLRSHKRLLIWSFVGAIVVCIAAVVLIGGRRVTGRIDRVLRYSGDQTAFSIDVHSANSYLSFHNGLAVASPDGLQCFDANGEQTVLAQCKMDNPVLLQNRTVAMGYGVGSSGICAVHYAKGEQLNLTVPGTILDADLSDDGYICCASTQPGYKTVLTVYNADGTQIYSWLSSTQFFGQCAVSGDGRSMCAVALGIDSGSYASTAICFATDETEPVAKCSLGSDFIYDLSYVGKRALCAVGENALYFFDADSEQAAEFSYEGGDLLAYELGADGFIPIVRNMNQAGGRYRVTTVSASGAELASLSFDEPIQDISANGAYLAVLTSKGLRVYDSRLRLCLSRDDVGFATRVCVQRDGAALLIDGSSARRIS